MDPSRIANSPTERTVAPAVSDAVQQAPSPCGAASVQPTAASGEQDSSTAAVPPALSKNQQKKLIKKQKMEAAREARKAQRKEKRAATKERQAQQLQQHLAQMTEQERAEAEAQLVAEKLERSEMRRTKKQRLQQATDGGQRIVIDLDFGELMSESEIRSLCQQLSFSYSANTHTRVPCHMHLTSADGAVGQQLRRQIAGTEHWVVNMTGESYMDVFAQELQQLVYLTADSPHELAELDPSKVYIIGGIVDRNRHKQLCWGKAVGQGIATARLPILQHVPLGRSQVITVDQVVRILLGWLDKRDWGSVLRAVIPARKLQDYRPGGQQGTHSRFRDKGEQGKQGQAQEGKQGSEQESEQGSEIGDGLGLEKGEEQGEEQGGEKGEQQGEEQGEEQGEDKGEEQPGGKTIPVHRVEPFCSEQIGQGADGAPPADMAGPGD